METETAIAYCRVSDPRQVKRNRGVAPEREKDSLERQEAKAKAFAERSGWFFRRSWLEEGESAKTEDRPKLWEMYAWCKKNRGNVQVLIIPMIDRFARNIEDYHDLKRQFRALGVRIASVNERIEDTPEGRLQENVLASFAQFDNERRAERCKDGMVEAVRAGRWVWKAPYGFRNVKLPDLDPNIAPFDPEARIILRAFEMVATRMKPPSEVFQELRAVGMPWSRSQFYAALRNPIYVGRIQAFGMETEGTGSFVPVVPDDLFWRVQYILAGAGQPHRKTYSIDHVDFPLRGTVRCACEKLMTASWTSKTHQRFGYYRCMACAGGNHRKDTVETDFSSALNSRCWPEPVFEEVGDRVGRWWKRRHETDRIHRRRTIDQQQRLRDLQKALALKAAEGVVPDDIAREQIDDLRRQAAGIGNVAVDVTDPAIDLPEVLDFGKRLLVTPGTFWEAASPVAKKTLQTFLLPNGATYTRSERFAISHFRLLQPTSGGIMTSSPDWWTRDENLAIFCRDLLELSEKLLVTEAT